VDIWLCEARRVGGTMELSFLAHNALFFSLLRVQGYKAQSKTASSLFSQYYLSDDTRYTLLVFLSYVEERILG
jgi:hypothetical protein